MRRLSDGGTRHQTSNPYNPRQNGVSEITNRTICRIARAAISESGLSVKFWPEALSRASRRSPSPPPRRSSCYVLSNVCDCLLLCATASSHGGA